MRRFAFPLLLDRYIARLMIVPVAATLTLSAMLLLLDKLRRLLDFVVREGGSPSLVWQMLANIIPTYVSFGLTMGLMLGVVLAFRRLALNSELDVLRATGVAPGRLLAVPFCLAAVLGAANLAIIGYVQPHARYAYKRIEFDLRSGALGMAVEGGEFSRFGNQRTLRVGRIDDGTLEDVFLVTTEKGHHLTISARRGIVLASADREALVLRLADGRIVDGVPGTAGRTPRVLDFTSHDVRVPLPNTAGMAERGSDSDELTLAELARAVRVPAAHVSSRQALANLNFRLVEVASLFVLPFIGLALAVPPKRSTSGVGVFLSVVVVVAWYKVAQYALAMAAGGRIDPVLGLWLPFVVFAGGGFAAYRRYATGGGGGAIALLDRWWRAVRDRLRPRRRGARGAA